MKPIQAVVDHSLPQFLQYLETGKFVNVGMLVTGMRRCLLPASAEKEMPARMKARSLHQHAPLV